MNLKRKKLIDIMASFHFRCVKNKHLFSIEIDTGEDGRNEMHPEYKRVRPLIVCSYPGCGQAAAKGEIENDMMSYPSPISKADKLAAARQENRELTMIARKQAMEELRLNPQKMTEVARPAGESGKFGGARESVPTSVVESLIEKGKEMAKNL